MTHRIVSLIVILIYTILVPSLVSGAQVSTQVWRIGFLSGGSSTTSSGIAEAFQQELHKLGYVEGQNVRIAYRWAEGRYERLPALVEELIRLKVDVIFTPAGTPGALAAKRATSTIPIVFRMTGDPVAAGIVPSLARPGGNITGIVGASIEVHAKRLELLKEVVPEANHVAVLWNPANQSHPAGLKILQEAALTLGIHLHFLEVQEVTDLERAFAALTSESAKALFVFADSLFSMQRVQIAARALQYRLPTIFNGKLYTEVGGLMSYADDPAKAVERAAVYVDKILQGTKPGELPVEQMTQFELVINLKTAKTLGLTIPQSLLFRADDVIQ